LKDLIRKAEVLQPERKTKPRVYYLNIPGKFVAGTVCDRAKEECIKEATCTLTDSESGKTSVVETDSFGDFWFEKLTTGSFTLKIESGGKNKIISGISTEKDVNLGEISLS